MKRRSHRRELSKVAPVPAGTPLCEIGDRTPLSCKQRNELIRVELGFGSYREYLESELWAGIRVRVLQQYAARNGQWFLPKQRCWVCLAPGTAAQVLHVVYTRGNLTGKTISNLRLVCELCRRAAEFDTRKLTAEESRQRMIGLANDPTWPSRAREIRGMGDGGSVKLAKAGSQSKGFEERRRQLAAGVKRNRKRARWGSRKGS